ncbi:N-acetylmuramoyl-L-alanine amidase-like domain-containing protein [Longimicrobium sp.]|uniref:N-acetylmuramoyl-L-alanine amidase-like domain-containing protein n=1 Tax=Longimicrobium sp. TaxID=2029185 RepID=UPI003B3A6343
MDARGCTRRAFVARAAAGAAALLLPFPLSADGFGAPGQDDRERLAGWLRTLRAEGLADAAPLGRAVARVGELALGTPYAAGTLEQYLLDGGSPDAEPLTLHLDRFDCVTLVESALAIARTAGAGPDAGWDRFAREVERMRYRGGARRGYTSRLHYFSEWIADGERRGLLRDLGPELGAERDERPLRFMSEHRASYPALRHDDAHAAIAEHERGLGPRNLIPKDRIPRITERLQTGDVLAFGTGIAGLDVTHTGLAYQSPDGVMRVLHAPLSGGVVQVSPGTVADYVNGLRNATGILAARPLRG